MKFPRLSWWSYSLAIVFVIASTAPPAGASTRNYLTVEGRVFDHLGAPLPGTWVFCLGSRRASVPVDSLGHYRLEIPGATLEELERAPLKIRIQARRRGYRYALSNGAPELGLEMRVIRDDSPLARLRVRSNDSSTVSAVANSVVLDANPRALLSAQFVGSPGAQYDTPPVPLEEGDEITLAGASQSIPELAAAEPAPVGVASRPVEAHASVVAITPGPPPTPASSQTPKTIGTGKVEHVTVLPSPPATGASGASDDTAKYLRMPVVLARPPASEPAPVVPQTTPAPEPRKWNAGRGGRDKGKPRVYHPAVAPETNGAPATIATPSRADTTTTLGPASVAAPSMPAATAPPTHRDVAPPATNKGPAADPGLRPVLPKDTPAERVAPGAQPPIRRVPSAPGIPPPALPRTNDQPSATPMCDCTIRGTVEVEWDRPLSSSTEVVIAVEDAPDVATSVELFMGSPRAFEIHPAPCGVHRLLLWTRSKQRFVLVSQEPRVVCTPGGVQQMRLVLEPVARWGAGQ